MLGAAYKEEIFPKTVKNVIDSGRHFVSYIATCKGAPGRAPKWQRFVGD
jgi:hypothetical protein